MIIYHLTIANFIKKAISFIEKVEPVISKIEPALSKVGPVLSKVEPFLAQLQEVEGTFKGDQKAKGFIHYYKTLANRTDHIQGEKKQILRESTRKILTNLSPIFDEWRKITPPALP